MAEGREAPSRRVVLADRLGGAPGRYAVAAVVLSVAWFPFRLLVFDRGDPIAAIVASGLAGSLWAFLPFVLEWAQHRRRTEVADRGGTVVATDHRAWVRRGALIGLAVGVPFYGVLIAICLITGRTRVYTIAFVLIVFGIVAVAIWNLRHNAGSRTRQRLAVPAFLLRHRR